VYLLSSDRKIREGPYFIASMTSPGVYTLSIGNGQPVKSSAKIAEKDLEKA
jgi:hypothetical protein